MSLRMRVAAMSGLILVVSGVGIAERSGLELCRRASPRLEGKAGR